MDDLSYFLPKGIAEDDDGEMPSSSPPPSPFPGPSGSRPQYGSIDTPYKYFLDFFPDSQPMGASVMPNFVLPPEAQPRAPHSHASMGFASVSEPSPVTLPPASLGIHSPQLHISQPSRSVQSIPSPRSSEVEKEFARLHPHHRTGRGKAKPMPSSRAGKGLGRPNRLPNKRQNVRFRVKKSEEGAHHAGDATVHGDAFPSTSGPQNRKAADSHHHDEPKKTRNNRGKGRSRSSSSNSVAASLAEFGETVASPAEHGSPPGKSPQKAAKAGQGVVEAGHAVATDAAVPEPAAVPAVPRVPLGFQPVNGKVGAEAKPRSGKTRSKANRRSRKRSGSSTISEDLSLRQDTPSPALSTDSSQRDAEALDDPNAVREKPSAAPKPPSPVSQEDDSAEGKGADNSMNVASSPAAYTAEKQPEGDKKSATNPDSLPDDLPAPSTKTLPQTGEHAAVVSQQDSPKPRSPSPAPAPPSADKNVVIDASEASAPSSGDGGLTAPERTAVVEAPLEATKPHSTAAPAEPQKATLAVATDKGVSHAAVQPLPAAEKKKSKKKNKKVRPRSQSSKSGTDQGSPAITVSTSSPIAEEPKAFSPPTWGERVAGCKAVVTSCLHSGLDKVVELHKRAFLAATARLRLHYSFVFFLFLLTRIVTLLLDWSPHALTALKFCGLFTVAFDIGGREGGDDAASKDFRRLSFLLILPIALLYQVIFHPNLFLDLSAQGFIAICFLEVGFFGPLGCTPLFLLLGVFQTLMSLAFKSNLLIQYLQVLMSLVFLSISLVRPVPDTSSPSGMKVQDRSPVAL